MLFLFRDSSAPAVVESSEKAFTQSNSSLAAHTAHAESAPTLLVTQEQIQATEEELASANDNDNDNDFIQPKESELSKLFTPPPVTPTATPPRVSPFEHKAAEVKNLHTIPKTAPHLETKKEKLLLLMQKLKLNRKSYLLRKMNLSYLKRRYKLK
ncbi:hypothetical protein QJS67_01900 [Acinetobacter radioresistens]|nr:hypothetical protein QJS67_01900 [Acinetobacter radioresistens]